MLKGTHLTKVGIAAALLLLINGEIAEGMNPGNEIADDSALTKQMEEIIKYNEDLIEIRALLIDQLIQKRYKISIEKKLLRAMEILKCLEDIQQRMPREKQH